MPEYCPPRTSLQAFAAGTLADSDSRQVEDHLATCLDCAHDLDTITREQLAALGPVQLAAAPGKPSSALAHLMETALGGFDSSSRLGAEAAVLAAFDPPERPDAIGSFAGYEILEIAGSGGMGVVLKAHDPTLHRDVALKVLSPNRAWNDADAARFLNEARTIASLQHDHVVAIFSAGREKGLPYLVMPFHAEGTLEGQLRQTPKLGADDVARIGLQLARALEATHAKGVLHRDIKPSNVLLEGGLDRVRLADFGLAEPVCADEAGRTKTIAGTPHYMSPEQARGEAIDARSDLFGLGALLHHLVTGRTIYEGTSTAEVLQAAARGQPAPARQGNPEIPAALASIIDRLLAPHPQERFASASEVVAAFAQWIERKGRFRRRARRAFAAGLAAAVLCGAVIVALDQSGRTAIINSLLCRCTGDGYHVRGRFGTHARLAGAVAASDAGDLIEARFSGEQLTDGFLIDKPVTLRAAAGFTPTLVATNNGQPLISSKAPLAVEGFTLIRRTDRINASPLVYVESGTLHLLNCRLLRAPPSGMGVLLRGARRLASGNDLRPYRPLIALSPGVHAYLRNSLVLGNAATGVGLRGGEAETIRIEAENCLWVVHRGFAWNRQQSGTVELRVARSVFATSTLFDLESVAQGGLAAHWEDCVFDRSQGTLLGLARYDRAARPPRLDWRETNVIYAGQGAYLLDRRGRELNSEAEWNAFMNLTTNQHRLTERGVFQEARVRSSQRLSAGDVDLAGLREGTGWSVGYAPGFVGEGEAYANFRRSPGYRDWEEQRRETFRRWRESAEAGRRTRQ